MLERLVNRFRTAGEPPEPSENAPSAPEAVPPLPDDIRQALMRLQSEWASMQLHWAEVLDKLQAWSSRQSARDRKAANKGLDRLAQDGEMELQQGPQLDPPAPHIETKDELRRRAAALYRRQA